MPDGGQLNPDAALPVLQRLATARGADIRHHTKVAALEVLADGVRLVLESVTGTEVVTAAQAVVTAGGWTGKLLGRESGAGLQIPRLRVTQEQPAHFRVTDDGALWPGFNHYPGAGSAYGNWYSPVYGMQTPGEGIKAGWHGVGPEVDPDRRIFLPEPAAACRPAVLRPRPGCPAWTRTPSRPSAAPTPPPPTRTLCWTGSGRW